MAQNIISRSQWGARHRDGFRDRPMPISEYWLHHSVTIAPDLLPPFDDDDRAIRTLEDIGQQRFGGGISYTYPVTPVGRIYQGLSLHRQGAHTKGHNTAGAAFVLVGDYSTRSPTAAQEFAIAYRMVLDHRAGKSTTHQLNGGHRDVFGTSCPGGAAYGRIPAINKLARDLWIGVAGAGGSGGTTPTGGGSSGGATFEQEEDIMASIEEVLAGVEKIVREQTDRGTNNTVRGTVAGVWDGYRTNDFRSPIGLLRDAAGGVDYQRLAAELAPLLKGGTSQADLEAALRSVLGSLDNQ